MKKILFALCLLPAALVGAQAQEYVSQRPAPAQRLFVSQAVDARIAQVEQRLGLKIEKLEIGQVDFLKDSAFIKVYYTLEKGESNSIDSLRKAKDYVD